MPTFEALHDAAHQRLNLRKAQKSIALVGRKSRVELINLASATPGNLPDFTSLGFMPMGRVTTDGFTFGREEEMSEQFSHGHPDAGRVDSESVNRTISTTVQETFRRNIREMVKGADYSRISFNPGGFLVLDEPGTPDHEEWTMVTLFRDGPPDNQFIFGRIFGSIKLWESGEEVFGGEDALQQELTWRVLHDEDYGTPVKEFYGGTGFEKLARELGYTGQAPVAS